tara:strand:+ start:244 stop:618 length:375 start_codon:yes stop_codon:yes gene_type:complete
MPTEFGSGIIVSSEFYRTQKLSRRTMTLREFQQLIRNMYHDKDAARGVEGTFMWLTEEIGELATALRSGSAEEQSLEFADVLAWLVTIANVADIDLEQAVAKKYGQGCPGCGQTLCTCPDAEKP